MQTVFNRHLAGIALCASILFAAPRAMAMSGLKFSEDLIPRFNVPRILGAPPVIDGKIDLEEWKGAVKVMGMANTGGVDYRDRPVSFWLAWDESHLYIAARSDILPGHRLYRNFRQKYDQGVVCDDAYEFGIFLHDRNKKPGEESSFLKIVLNSLGSGEYMKLYPSIGQNMYNWTPHPKIANRVYEENGRQWWDMELALDLADLELPAANKPGDNLDILLAADLKNPSWQWLDAPSASGHLEQYGFPRATLTQDAPYVQVEELSGLHDEKLALKSAIYNPTAAPVKVKVAVRIKHGTIAKFAETAKTVVDENRELVIPPNGVVRFDVEKAFPGLIYEKKNAWTFLQCSQYDYEVDLADDAKQGIVYKYHLQFSGTDKQYLNAVPRTTVFDYELLFNPVRGVLQLSGDTLDAQIPKYTRPAAMAYVITRDSRTIKEGKITQYVNQKFEDLVELPALEPGKYQVRLSLIDAEGKVLVSRGDGAFVKKDEPQEFSEWWNNSIGNTEKVLKPFEPLRVVAGGDTTIRCTRREYSFDGLGLPRQIVSNGGNVFTRPARIVLTVGGKEYEVAAAGQIRITSQKDWRVEFSGAAVEAAGVQFSSSGWMEQDGLVNLDVQYAPAVAAASIDIQALRVEWPIDDSAQNYMCCIGFGGNYSPRYIDKVPDGQGPIWNTLDAIGNVGSGMTAGNFYDNLWVGNDQRGLLWAADSDKGWLPCDTTPAHSLFREGKTVTIRNHLINLPAGAKPFSLTAPRSVQLQYNATPFRNLAKGWRLNQISAGNSFSSSDPKNPYKYNEKTKKDYFGILSMPSAEVAEWPVYYAKYKASAEEKLKSGLYNMGPRFTYYLNNEIPLRGYMDKTLEPGIYDYFSGDWIPGAESLNKSYIDYMIHLMDRQVKEGGCAHFYFDISFVRSIKNLPAGFGYRLPDNRIQPGGMCGTLRDWYKRVWALMQENDLYPGGVSGHGTNSISLKALPWADSILDSEYPMKDPIAVYPSNRMIALSYPQNFGVHITHLRFMNPFWALMHDASMCSQSSFAAPEFRHFGITREDVEFVPYWKNEKVVKQMGQGLLCSVWKRPGAAVLGIMNYGPDPDGVEKERPCELTLDLAGLGIKTPQHGLVRVSDFWEGPQIVDSHLNSLKWYQDLPDSPHPQGWQDVKVKLRKLDKPNLELKSGKISGFDIQYHDTRFLYVTWDEKSLDPETRNLFDGDSLETVLEWGINRSDVRKLAGNELASAVTAVTEGVAADVWTKPEAVLMRVSNSTNKRVDAVLKLDLEKLGVKVQKLWSQFIDCQGGKLDAASGELIVTIEPGKMALIRIVRN